MKESTLYKTIENDFIYQKSKHEEYKKLYTQERTLNQDSITSEREIRQLAQNESDVVRSKLVDEMKRIESDLVRVRAGRDQVQTLLDIRIAKDAVEFLQVNEIRGLANERKDRIECLESEVSRIRLELDLLKKESKREMGGKEVEERIAFYEKVLIISQFLFFYILNRQKRCFRMKSRQCAHHGKV